MIANHIHDALAQVRELQQRILERQRFRGYSGGARMCAGTFALIGAWVMSWENFPYDVYAHVLGWGTVFFLAILTNYGSLLYWFVKDAGLHGDVRVLRPTVEVFPPLVAGGMLTLAVLLDGNSDYLFGIWMSLFGLANIASRHVLPHKMGLVGCFYLACGAVCLFSPVRSFLNPWPMGMVFFIGELAGGILISLDQKTVSIRAKEHKATPAEEESAAGEAALTSAGGPNDQKPPRKRRPGAGRAFGAESHQHAEGSIRARAEVVSA